MHLYCGRKLDFNEPTCWFAQVGHLAWFGWSEPLLVSPMLRHMTGRALLIVPDHAYMPTTGGGQRSALFFEALSSVYEVDLLIIAEFVPPGYFEDLYGAKNFRQEDYAPAGMRGFWRYLRPLNRNIVDRVSAAIAKREQIYNANEINGRDYSKYDVVVARYLKTAARAGAIDAGVPLLIDIDDRDDFVIKKRIEEPGLNPAMKMLLTRQHQQVAKLFPKYIRSADHLWFVTAGDYDDLRHPSVSVLPNIPFVPNSLEALPAAPKSNKTLLFVGAAEHRPNSRGIVQFIQRSWPLVLVAVPNARLRIVGRGDWSNQMPVFNTANNVDFIGEVDDLSTEYKLANLVVSPVFEGGGSKIKVVEAYAFNRAVVAARHSVRGFDSLLDAGVIATADSDEDIADRCIDLLGDPEKTNELAARGRQIILERFNRDVFAKVVIKDCQSAVSQQARARSDGS